MGRSLLARRLTRASLACPVLRRGVSLVRHMLTDSDAHGGIHVVSKVIYIARVSVGSVAFLLVLYPLVAVNLLLFRLDSKLSAALTRRFCAQLDAPARNLPDDSTFHFEYDTIVKTQASINRDWAAPLPLLLALPTLFATLTWYKAEFHPCSSFGDGEEANQTTALELTQACCADRSTAARVVLPCVAILVFVGTFWPVMDPNGKYSVSSWRHIQRKIRSCTQDQLQHLTGGRPVLVAFLEANAPEMQLFGVRLSPERARLACCLWLSLLSIPILVGGTGHCGSVDDSEGTQA
jgi:hypothetical protein